LSGSLLESGDMATAEGVEYEATGPNLRKQDIVSAA
jgi:hypothetical protein